MNCSSDRCGACPLEPGSECLLCARGRCELAAKEKARRAIFPGADTYWTDRAREHAGMPPAAEIQLENSPVEVARPPADPDGPGYPPLWSMAWSFVKDATKHAVNGMPKATEEVYAHRRAVCVACEHLTEEGRCGKGGCGCHMQLKASWAGAACPFGKWER